VNQTTDSIPNMTEYRYGYMRAIKERCIDLTITGYAEAVAVVVAFQNSDTKRKRWKRIFVSKPC